MFSGALSEIPHVLLNSHKRQNLDAPQKLEDACADIAEAVRHAEDAETVVHCGLAVDDRQRSTVGGDCAQRQLEKLLNMSFDASTYNAHEQGCNEILGAERIERRLCCRRGGSVCFRPIVADVPPCHGVVPA